MQCAKLQALDLSNNDIATIPPELGLLTQLSTLNLVGNPVKAIRMNVLSKPTAQLLEYLRDRIVQ